MLDIEAIAATLWTTVSSAQGLVSSSRRPVKWDEVSATAMPFLCMSERPPIAKPKTGAGQTKEWDLWFDLLLYVAETDKTLSPGVVLNPMITAVGATLDPPATSPGTFGKPGTQTLGIAAVQHCWIEGEIPIFEGVLGEKAVAVIPVKIRALG